MNLHRLLPDKQAAEVATERHMLFAHHELGLDSLNMLFEQYLMSNEEVNTLRGLTNDVVQRSRSRSTSKIEWLKKIIRATHIQLKEDELCLAYVENEHTLLTKNSRIHR